MGIADTYLDQRFLRNQKKIKSDMQQDWTNSSGATYSQFTRIFDQEPGQHARIQVFGWSQDFTDQNL